MARGSGKVLPCVECLERFTAQDVEDGNYFPKTMMCLRCYVALQRKPRGVSCFGKPQVILAYRTQPQLLGYNPRARECQGLCPDREVCRAFVRGELTLDKDDYVDPYTL